MIMSSRALCLVVVCLVLHLSESARTLRHRYVSVSIGDGDCDVDDYGAKGDGNSDDTTVRLTFVRDSPASFSLTLADLSHSCGVARARTWRVCGSSEGGKRLL